MIFFLEIDRVAMSDLRDHIDTTVAHRKFISHPLSSDGRSQFKFTATASLLRELCPMQPAHQLIVYQC